jgi:hypothetical protein
VSDDQSRTGKELQVSDWDAWNMTFYHRAIQAKIGNELRAQYALPDELPSGFLRLLDKIERGAGRE